jgi:5-methylcytosine-specific restriction protein B
MQTRQYWWVSQGTSITPALRDKCLRAPQRNKGGRALFYWDNLARVRAGDLIFHYADGAIRAVSIATGNGHEEEVTHGKGWRVDVEVHPLNEPAPLEQFNQRLVALNLDKGPVGRNGTANPGYLFELTPEAVEAIVRDMRLNGLPRALAITLNEWKTDKESFPMDAPALLRDFQAALMKAGLAYSDSHITRFLASLLAKRFVILTGLSGSGKTRLAQAFAKWITQNADDYAVIAVGADWTSNEHIAGYPDRLNSAYAGTDARALILRAGQPENKSVPHVLILDEMNLSHVERYFADALSAMESGEPLRFHNDDVSKFGPRSAPLPDNLFIIGTVNVDETTHPFSPKVLDRANVIAFSAGREGMAQVLHGANVNVNLQAIAGEGAPHGETFVQAAQSALPVLSADEQANVKAELLLLFDALDACGMAFGYRVASEMMRFIAHYKTFAEGVNWINDAIDAQIAQKLLSKLSGSRATLAPAVRSLAVLCSRPAHSGDAHIAQQLEEARNDAGEDPITLIDKASASRYPLSAGMLVRLWRALDANGFASFMDV